ncbi:MAG TPA: twin-arginine translocation signal domain-containing protein [Tepidisphaeraceae bacterium]|jgi:hypothetical protein|nr:twin-arginine translocation signal domain-containing protein [Tepidisphaeraceae bacterium]
MHRRQFLKGAALGSAALVAGHTPDLLGATASTLTLSAPANAFPYRIAFGCWMNDVRLTPLPLEDWPAPQLDDETALSLIRTMDVQQAAGFNFFDVWGFFATFGWPVDIQSAIDEPRRQRINKILAAAKERGIKMSLGFGTYSWGYDAIIAADPEVRGKQADGLPHPHAMCDANPKSFEYVKKILDFVLGQWDFGAVHLESCDLGCCMCKDCAGKDGIVGYNARINKKTAEYIKSKWPQKTVYVITINWVQGHPHFTEEEKAHVVELSKNVDCIFDQGHTGFHVDPATRREFIPKLKCAYGTSGNLWLYPDQRFDRASFFLPFVKRAVTGIKEQFADGVRACLYYQGPVSNAGTEIQIAAGGRALSDTSKSVEEILASSIEPYYKPKDTAAHQKLVDLFLLAEECYFGNWPAQKDSFLKLYGFVPGEFKLWQGLFGKTPGPATYLLEPMLAAKGRAEYKKGLESILRDLPTLAGKCDDGGRLENIQRSITVTLTMLNTVSNALHDTP